MSKRTKTLKLYNKYFWFFYVWWFICFIMACTLYIPLVILGLILLVLNKVSEWFYDVLDNTCRYTDSLISSFLKNCLNPFKYKKSLKNYTREVSKDE